MASRSHLPAVLSVLFGLALALASVFGPATAHASTCAQSSYTLNTQSSVDVLGNTGCTAVLGDLTITGSGITSLATLSNITSIGGDLSISSNANLGTLGGLDSLTSVTGAVTVNSNGSLYSICDLQNVTTIGGDLVIASNAGLQNAECPWSLQDVGGNIRFEDNPSIWTLSYLRGLATHSGSITIHNSMDQLYFGADSPLALTEIGGDLVIEENTITNVDELVNLTSVGGALTISGNNSLDDVDGLINLGSVGGNLTVQSNATLGDCLGFVPLLGYPNGPDSVGGTVTIASNQSGCNSVADIFAGVQPPGQPTITGITAGDSQITLTASVTEQGTFAITGYRGVCTDSQNNSFTSTGTGSSVTVTGLTNGTAYTCTVVALSDGGESQPSGESIPKTPEEKPEVDPAVLWLVIKGSGYVEEESETPAAPDTEGPISSGSICYQNQYASVWCERSFALGDGFDNSLNIGEERAVTVGARTILSIPVSLASTYSAFKVIFEVTDISGPSSRDTAIWVSKGPGGPYSSCGVRGTSGSYISREFGDGQGCFSNHLAAGYWFNFAILKAGGARPWDSTPLESDEISNFQSATVTVSQEIPEGYDLDGDQVPDFEDLCPNTPANEGVNSDGCSDSQIGGESVDPVEDPPFSPSPDSGDGGSGTSNTDDCVVTTWNSCGESDGGTSTGGDVSTGSTDTGSSNYDNACTNISADVDCRKLFAGDLGTQGGEVNVNISKGTVLSIPFMRETSTVPVAIGYQSFQSANNYFFDAWLSLTANGEILPGGNCNTSQPYAESKLNLKAQSGAGTGCTLPSGDGLVWLNFKFWNPFTGDLGSYSIGRLDIFTY